MSNNTKASMMAVVVCLGVLLIAPATGQSTTSATTQDSANQHHQRLYQMMKDMNQEMGGMTEKMSRGGLTPEQGEQMGRDMAQMSTMMRRMSGLAAKPAMREADYQEQMDQMRKQMDEMMRDSSMKPAAK